MNTFSKILFAAYILILLWLVLFKFSYDPAGVISGYQTRNINLIPFSYANRGEVISNVIAFIPFGVMLGLTFKGAMFARKIALIFAFSLAVELIQFALAIGVTDITDLIMNTLGGFLGLGGYVMLARHTNDKYLDWSILIAGTLLLLTALYLRIFVFIVKY